ncbi:MAG TPA: SUMF1/EgtB/PvdO family nonheme iron enzyme, partial [Thermoanaerobaculia bacterium]|nr:SUMF1/EgtB/PvdO family nonheme iron enzyme [Thermoanaerobaculia bacterium]
HEGRTFIAMELVEGRTLRQLIAEGPLPLDQAMRLAIQIADGLSRAHAAGIVHRDLKPENIMVTDDGLVKILDFGLARPVAFGAEAGSATSTYAHATAEGVMVGTPRYMSPEQLSGGPVDERSDQFALGMVLYEMVSGKPAFDGPSLPSIISAIVRDAPAPLRQSRPDAPAGLVKVIDRCLAKSPDDRYPSTADVCRELRELERRLLHGGAMPLRPRTIAAALAVIGVLAVAAAVMWFRGAEQRWAHNDAPGQIAARIESGKLYDAYRLLLRARKHRPDDPELEKMFGRITLPIQVVTEPPGAKVSVKGYATPNAPWERLGVTPLKLRVPYALMRWRIEKEGFETFEGAPLSGGSIRTLMTGLALDPAGTAPPGMVRVPSSVFRGGPHRLDLPAGMMALPVDTYWLDRFEVTNRQFKEFVDAGGYSDEALQPFRDATGRPGPATWSLGTFPDGAADLPVGGVSWHEADAYCRAAGKTLPTIYHWFSAVGQEQLSDILRLSNFDGEEPAPVGKYQGLAGFGAYDMAGNVREWCSNATGAGERYILGGAWNDPPYMFRHIVARPPADRLPQNGFRCAMYPGPVSEVMLDPVDPRHEIANPPPPVAEEIFEAYAGMYAYQRSDLQAEVEHVDDSSAHWRKEVVSFKAAYGDETMRALLFVPRNASPPYQAVVWFPGDDVFIFRSSETLASSYLFDFIPRSGRVLVYPIYQGMYERWVPFGFQPIEWRDRVIVWSKDLGRTLDYLETRSDIDSDKIAYYGFSSGAIYGPVFTTVEPRIRASILLGGGVVPRTMRPEMDLAHFAPRSRVPTLMINGLDDFIMPYDSSQKPLFDLLAAPPEDKRHARLEGGHIPTRRQDMIREILDWLDRYLGPVQTGGPAVASK